MDTETLNIQLKKIQQFDNKESLENILENYTKNEIENQDLENLLDDLVNQLREYYMDNEEMYVFESLDSKSQDLLNNSVESATFIFKSFAPIRSLTINDAIQLIDDILDNWVFRKNLDFFEKWNGDDKKTKDMKKLSFALNVMTEDCVIKNLTEASIKKSFEINTRIESFVASYISQKINSCFSELKINVLLNQLNKNNGN